MKTRFVFPRFPALWLILSLSLPNSALALRQTGLEESDSLDNLSSVKKQLVAALEYPANNPETALRNLADHFSRAIGLAPSTSPPPAAGAEEEVGLPEEQVRMRAKGFNRTLQLIGPLVGRDTFESREEIQPFAQRVQAVFKEPPGFEQMLKQFGLQKEDFYELLFGMRTVPIWITPSRHPIEWIHGLLDLFEENYVPSYRIEDLRVMRDEDLLKALQQTIHEPGDLQQVSDEDLLKVVARVRRVVGALPLAAGAEEKIEPIIDPAHLKYPDVLREKETGDWYEVIAVGPADVQLQKTTPPPNSKYVGALVSRGFDDLRKNFEKVTAAGVEEVEFRITTPMDEDFWDAFYYRLTDAQLTNVMGYLQRAQASGRQVEITAVTGLTDFHLHTDAGLAMVAKQIAQIDRLEGVAFHFPGDLSKRAQMPDRLEQPGLAIPDKMMPNIVWPEDTQPSVRVTEPIYAADFSEIRPAGWIALSYNPKLTVQHILSQKVLLITIHDDQGTAILAFA